MKVWRTLDELSFHVMQFLEFPNGKTAKDKLNENRTRKIQTIKDFQSGNDSMYPYRLDKEKMEEIINGCVELDIILTAESRKEMQKAMAKGLYIGFGRTEISSSQRIPIRIHLWNTLKINFDENSAKDKKHGIEYFDLRFLDWYELTKEEQVIVSQEFRLLDAQSKKIMPDSAILEETTADIVSNLGNERKGPGRRAHTDYDAIEAEMRRRAGDGELCMTLKAEANHLETWTKEHNQTGAPSSAGQIVKKFRGLYKTLKSAKTEQEKAY